MLTLARALMGAVLLWLPVAGAAQSCIWFGSKDALSQVQAGASSVALSLPSPDAQAIAMDGRDCSVWVLGKTQLSKYDPGGALVHQIALQGIDKKLEGAGHLTVDAYDGSVWVSGHKAVAHLSPTGLVLRQPPFDGFVRSAAAALDQSLWLLGDKQIARFSALGVALPPIDLKLPLDNEPKRLAVDSVAGVFWVTTSKKVLQLRLDRPDQAAQSIRMSDNIAAIALNPLTSQLWVADGASLHLYGLDGNLVQTVDLAALGLKKKAENIAFDPVAKALWVWTKDGVARLSAQGALQALFPANYGAGLLAVPAFWVRPGITLIEPPSDALTNNAQRPISLGYEAHCNGQPCGFAPGYLASYRLNARLNNNPIGSLFTFDAATSRATYTPATRLPEGRNTLEAQARDANGHLSNALAEHFTVDTIAPAISIASPRNGLVTQQPAQIIQGTVSEPASLLVNNASTAVSPSGSFAAPVTLQDGLNKFTLAAIDGAGNTGQAQLELTLAKGEPPVSVPPEPATVATPIDPTVATLVANSTAFLYSGANPIQTGVAPGTIVPKRAAVLRGKVTTRDNQPLPGIKIAILGHPEFGQTLTRENGMFDMAVNGGGILTIRYEKPGFLPLQRQVSAPWQDFVIAPDVVMIALDAQVTPIAANAAAMQVARGSVSTDADGARQATLLFPQGTTATMTLPDGSTQALGTLNVRATEYTVGANGPKAMPASLPPTSGYTYAVELSVDEAIAVGATEVRFSQPVPVYVDNFLDFPVGGIVPAGYYDRGRAAWIPAPNGRVVKVLAVQDGRAALDTNGDGAVDDAAQLAALHITDAERTKLATLYAAGQTLWRVPVSHFTPWDYNWPYGPPPDATEPKQPLPETEEKQKEDDPTCQGGSVIECQNQTLGERIAVTGAPFSLNYRSDRVPGRVTNTVLIPLSGASVPASLKRIELEVNVAGRQFNLTFPASVNQSYVFTWDGKDGYGRTVTGTQPVTIKTGYVYGAVYQQPASFAQSFGASSGVPLSRNTARQEITLWQTSRATMEALHDARSQGLGGWTASVHHHYDLVGQTLLLGDGTRRSAASINGVMTTVAGNGTNGSSGDGGPATAAGLHTPAGISIDPQGNLFIATDGGQNIRKVSPEGIITTVAGNGNWGFSGDGGPAIAASLSYPAGISTDAQGNLFIADVFNHRIRKVSPEGIITTVAGNGSRGFSGDGGPATAAALYRPYGICTDPQGNLFIADVLNQRIRKVSPEGIITTVAGNGNWGFSGDGGPAIAASLLLPKGISIDAQGNLFIADTYNNRIRKVSPEGIITTVAGNGTSGFSGDGGLATAAALNRPYGISTDLQGNLFIPDGFNARIRKVSPEGIITTVAGNGNYDFSGDGGPAIAASLKLLNGISIDPHGNQFIADYYNGRIRKVSALLPPFNGNEITIASQDGAELYYFDSVGRHRGTVNARTGAARYTFAYDGQGLLSQITDADGNATRIERDSAGNATAIDSADNQRTALTLDANGYLATVTNPAGEATRITYTASGLLSTFTDPRGNTSRMEYDARGRLVSDQNAAGGGSTLARTDLPGNSYEVSLTSAEGRRTRYRVEHLPTGEKRRTNLYPDGTASTTLTQTDGTTQTTAPDGSMVTRTEGPDPRFGMQAPIETSRSLRLPSGLTHTTTVQRTARLADPKDLTSLVQETTTNRVNGRVFTSVYDAASRQTSTTSAAGRGTVIRTDAQGRPLFAQTAGLEPETYTYDPRGRLSTVTQGSGTQARTLAYGYGADGFVERITDPLGREVVYQRDAAGRPLRTSLPGPRVLAASFDANGNPSTITPPGQPAHALAYTPVDLESQYTPPALPGIANSATAYAYSRDKDLSQISYPDGTGVTLSYSQAGQLSALTPSAGAGQPIGFGYSPTTGQLSVIDNADAAITVRHDGPLPVQESTSGLVTSTVARSFDANLRLSQLSVNGNASSYAYDPDSLLIQAGPLTIARHPGHGAITATTLGAITTSHSWSGFGELASFSASEGANSLLAYQLAYDRAGRITSKVETVAGGAAVRYDYGYDAAGRLASLSRDGLTIATWGYDANGNRTQLNGATVASVDAQDRLITQGSTRYSYTANGTLLEKTQGEQATGYTYDALGNLKTVTLPGGGRIDYLVDGVNRRIGKKVNGTLVQGLVYEDKLRVAAELDGAGTVIARFIHADKPNVPALMHKGGATYRIVTDHLGSVRLVVDAATGAIAQRIDYDAWGQVTSDSNPGFQPFGYAGGLYEPSTGLVRFGARDYDAQTGRWTAKDPIRFGGGDANLFAYVGGSPLNFADPLGLQASPGATPHRPIFPNLNPQIPHPPGAPSPAANQVAGATRDFMRNYSDMRDANTIGGDNYFHCKANCEAATRGNTGDKTACLLSDAREWVDQNVKGDPASASALDQAANTFGRSHAGTGGSCAAICSIYRPHGLPSRY